jgi:predicted Zn-dependent protease
LTLLDASSLAAAQEIQADARVKSAASASSGSAVSLNSSLTCLVRNLLGRPLSGISVEVRDIKTHATVTSAISGPNGAAVFYGLAPGRYEVTVADGLLPPRRELQVDRGDSQTVLELPLSQAHEGQTVSVRALAIPHNAKEALGAATDAWQKQQWKKARAQVMRALSLWPGYGAGMALLGFLDLQDGALEQACANLTRAIEAEPNSPLVYIALGSAYNSMKRYEDALAVLSVFPSVSADTWQVHYEQARAFIGLRKYEAGLQEINSSQQLTRQDAAVLHLAKAHALLGLHRNAEAAVELETIVRNQPRGPYASDAQSLLAALRSQKQ